MFKRGERTPPPPHPWSPLTIQTISELYIRIAERIREKYRLCRICITHINTHQQIHSHPWSPPSIPPPSRSADYSQHYHDNFSNFLEQQASAFTVIRFISIVICTVVVLDGLLDEAKLHMHIQVLQVRISASTSVPSRPTTVQMPNWH
jgi:hypothetical protein